MRGGWNESLIPETTVCFNQVHISCPAKNAKYCHGDCWILPRRGRIKVCRHLITYNPALPRISNILRKHFNILHSSNRCKDVFKQPPFVAYRRISNLRDLLVKAQLPVISNNHFPPGSFRCGQNCTVPLVHTLLTASQFIPFTLQVKHAPSLHTLLVTLKMWSTGFNVTVVIYNI